MKSPTLPLVAFLVIAVAISSLFLYNSLQSNANVAPPKRAVVTHKTVVVTTSGINHIATKRGKASIPPLLIKSMAPPPSVKFTPALMRKMFIMEGYAVAKGPTSRPSNSTRHLAHKSHQNQMKIKEKTKQLRDIEKKLAEMKRLLQDMVDKKNKAKQRRRRYRIVKVCKKLKGRKVCKYRRIYRRRSHQGRRRR